MIRLHTRGASGRQLDLIFNISSMDPGDGKRVTAVEAVCGKCGWKGQRRLTGMRGTTGDDSAREAAIIARKFETQGWVIGTTPAQHRCPACANPKRDVAPAASPAPIVTPPTATLIPKVAIVSARQRAVVEEATAAIAAALNKEPTMPTTKPEKPVLTLAEPPRQMSRDDRRVIFEKLNDVYLDEKRGYEAPWTDQAVAKDLGVPVAWVREMREQNFGPENNNADLKDLIAKADALVAEAGRLNAESGALILKMEEVRKAADGVERRLTDVRNALR